MTEAKTDVLVLKYHEAIAALDELFLTKRPAEEVPEIFSVMLTVHVENIRRKFVAIQAALPEGERRKTSQYLAGLAEAFAQKGD